MHIVAIKFNNRTFLNITVESHIDDFRTIYDKYSTGVNGKKTFTPGR